ncbi:MAG: low molecular weight phosphotyrosine protein phosphatase [Clostridia bacterium]|nr:low molecular weight phosphotyrosine protein phosphatase [Clostridia bacterium]
MIRILFVCLGNICRSPMAEMIFRDMVKRRGLAGRIECASAGTSDEEEGNPVYPPARETLSRMGIGVGTKRAVQMTRSDYAKYDLLIGMEQRNIAAMRRICGGDPGHKIRRLLDGTPRPRDIADPWYTGNFDLTRDDIVEGCEALLESLVKDLP